jgi:hypothetical protein
MGNLKSPGLIAHAGSISAPRTINIKDLLSISGLGFSGDVDGGADFSITVGNRMSNFLDAFGIQVRVPFRGLN